MIKLLDIALPDSVTERVRRNIADAIRELQNLPLAFATVIEDVVLEDGVVTPVPHGLGRRVRWVRESCVRNALSVGRIEEIRDGKLDLKLYVALKASGYGAKVTVSLVVL